MKRIILFCLTALLLTGCGGVTEEMLELRESAIVMMDNGDYEGAVAAFNELVAEADSVTDFELDILKYRAEAEFMLEDYTAAVHTYETLIDVDKERPEYCYFASMALAKAGSLTEAEAMLVRGTEQDKKNEAPGFFEASMALAEAYEISEGIENAKAIYQSLIDGGHGTTYIYNRLMVFAMENEQYNDALTLAAKGMALTDGIAIKELKFNEAVCYEYMRNFNKALELFETYVATYGSDERAEHEIAFLRTR